MQTRQSKRDTFQLEFDMAFSIFVTEFLYTSRMYDVASRTEDLMP
jgi:hypothetical protein